MACHKGYTSGPTHAALSAHQSPGRRGRLAVSCRHGAWGLESAQLGQHEFFRTGRNRQASERLAPSAFAAPQRLSHGGTREGANSEQRQKEAESEGASRIQDNQARGTPRG